MSTNSFLIKLERKKPKAYQILHAVAEGERRGQSRPEIFRALGVSISYGYEVVKKYQKELEDISYTKAEVDQNPSKLLHAKKILVDASPELARVLVDIAKIPDQVIIALETPGEKER